MTDGDEISYLQFAFSFMSLYRFSTLLWSGMFEIGQ